MSQNFNYDEAVLGCKTMEDITGPDGLIQKIIKDAVQHVLEQEINEYITSEKKKGNTVARNGSSHKTLKTSYGKMGIDVPRTRTDGFEPDIIKKRNVVEDGLESQVVSMYAKGMTTRDIVDHVQSLYGIEIKGRCAIIKTQRKGNGMKDTNIQWHPAFVSAIQLEFKEDREKLLFEKEHNLNTKPLQIDLLVIRKEENGTVENKIGKIFRKYNILEYKSPRQALDVDNFYKSAAYACLYKSYGKTVDERKAEEITVSIIRDGRPEKLFRYFKEHGIRTENPCLGVYYVMDKVLFPTQIIVAKELDGKHHTWLRSLTDKLEEKDMHRLLMDTSRLKGKQDKEFADSVLEVCFRANRQIIEKLKGDDTVSEALLEIMEPLIEPIIAEQKRMIEIQLRKETKEEMAKAKEEMAKAKEDATKAKEDATKAKEEAAKAKEEGIKNTILLLRKLGHNNDVIRTAIMEQYLLSDKEVTKYL